MEKRRTAILGMPKLVREWRKVCRNSHALTSEDTILTCCRRVLANGPSSQGKGSYIGSDRDHRHMYKMCINMYKTQYQMQKISSNSRTHDYQRGPCLEATLIPRKTSIPIFCDAAGSGRLCPTAGLLAISVCPCACCPPICAVYIAPGQVT